MPVLQMGHQAQRGTFLAQCHTAGKSWSLGSHRVTVFSFLTQPPVGSAHTYLQFLLQAGKLKSMELTFPAVTLLTTEPRDLCLPWPMPDPSGLTSKASSYLWPQWLPGFSAFSCLTSTATSRTWGKVAMVWAVALECLVSRPSSAPCSCVALGNWVSHSQLQPFNRAIMQNLSICEERVSGTGSAELRKEPFFSTVFDASVSDIGSGCPPCSPGRSRSLLQPAPFNIAHFRLIR